MKATARVLQSIEKPIRRRCADNEPRKAKGKVTFRASSDKDPLRET
jgi:hypothetical protein